jgi:hypothetical protein
MIPNVWPVEVKPLNRNAKFPKLKVRRLLLVGMMVTTRHGPAVEGDCNAVIVNTLLGAAGGALGAV